MSPGEPSDTAVLLTAFGTSMALCVLLSRYLTRYGVPAFLLFLAMGMVFGSQGVGHFPFENYALSYRLGTVALVLILFDGGMNTSRATLKAGFWPATPLATAGVFLTTLSVGVIAHWLGLVWSQALLVGAIVSSTDAAAVVAVLRGSGIHVKKRVAATLEIESGFNDPMAVFLTSTLTSNALHHESMGWHLAYELLQEMVVGAAMGWLIGTVGRWLLRRVHLNTAGLYPVLTLSIAFLAFGLPALSHGSSFLSVFVAGMLVGQSEIRYQSGVRRVHDALAWVSQVTMFLMLGLLVAPSRLLLVLPLGVVLGVALALIRPLELLPCLLLFRFTFKEALYISWVGLRGAVPIILATYPVLRGVQGANRLFDLVFFVVGVGALLPGATVPWVTRYLKMESGTAPAPPVAIELSSTLLTPDDWIRPFVVNAASAVAGARLSELPFPEEASALLVVRGSKLLAARGNTELAPGDFVYIFGRTRDLSLFQLMFGLEEDE
jgi:cell volume regulation protein A